MVGVRKVRKKRPYRSKTSNEYSYALRRKSRCRLRWALLGNRDGDVVMCPPFVVVIQNKAIIAYALAHYLTSFLAAFDVDPATQSTENFVAKSLFETKLKLHEALQLKLECCPIRCSFFGLELSV